MLFPLSMVLRGIPLEPTACTALNESHVIYGGEDKLLEAVKEAYPKYHPDLIVILSNCCSGIIGDDVESIACEAEKLVGCRVLALRNEWLGGDFQTRNSNNLVQAKLLRSQIKNRINCYM